jgi:hypothetical protein
MILMAPIIDPCHSVEAEKVPSVAVGRLEDTFTTATRMDVRLNFNFVVVELPSDDRINK